jgi:hypothetical protein
MRHLFSFSDRRLDAKILIGNSGIQGIHAPRPDRSAAFQYNGTVCDLSQFGQ